jgi:hypothetical protein
LLEGAEIKDMVAVREVAVLTFDHPLWDMDKLQIFVVADTAGHPMLLEEHAAPVSHQPVERSTIQKICRFIELNLSEFDGNKTNDIARMNHSIYVQALLDAIVENAAPHALRFNGFVDQRQGLDTGAGRHFEFLRRSLRNEKVQNEDYVWDEGY